MSALGPAGPGRTPFFEFARSLGATPAKTTFVRDHAGAWYHRGVQGVGPDVDSVAAHLREVAAAADVDDVVLLGNSAGGYAALLFGALLGWDAYAFSPQTFIDPQMLAACEDHRWALYVDALGDEMDPRYADLLPVLRQSEGRFHVYYPSELRLDVIHAERLEEVPRVSLHGIRYAGHGLVQSLRASGWLQSFLEALVSGSALPDTPPSVEAPRRARSAVAGSGPGVESDLEPGSPTLLVTFGGLGGGFGPLPEELARYATATPRRTIRIRDASGAWYHRGVEGVGPDVDAVAQWLGEVTAGAGRVVTAGVAAGGYAALLFGALAGAEVHAISPQTFLTPDDQSEGDLDERYADLRPVLARSRGTFHVYYAANRDIETAHAERLEGLPKVTLHPLMDPGNGLLKSLIRTRWTRTFAQALAAGADVPSPTHGE
jgi:acetyl esterase/lipase